MRKKTFIAVAAVTLGSGLLGVATQQAATAANPPTSDTTVRASQAADDTQADGTSAGPAVNALGAVVFSSAATNLVPITNGGHAQVYLRRPDGNVLRISRTLANVAGDGNSNSAAISPDGRYIAFASDATNLDATTADTNGKTDVYVYDRDPSGDGLDGPDHTLKRVSINGTTQGDGDSDQPAVADADGQAWVVFRTAAGNLVADGNAYTDIVISKGGTLSSVSKNGVNIPNGGSADPFIAYSNGDAHVVWDSAASNLASGDINGKTDVFLRGETASSAAGIANMSGETDADRAAHQGDSTLPSVSADGVEIVYQTFLDDVPDPSVPLIMVVNVIDASSGGLLTVNGAVTYLHANHPVVSLNGRFIAFRSTFGLVDGGGGFSQIYLCDLQGQAGTFCKYTRVSQSTAGDAANADSSSPSVTDGGYVAFASTATNLLAAGADSNGLQDVFLRVRDDNKPAAPTLSLTKGPAPSNDWRPKATVNISVSGGDDNPNGAVVTGRTHYVGRWTYSLGDSVRPSTTDSPWVVDDHEAMAGPDNGEIWYFEAQAVDDDGNFSPVAKLGPWKFDSARPTVAGYDLSIKGSPTVLPTTLTLRFKASEALNYDPVGVESGLAAYSVVLDRYAFNGKHTRLLVGKGVKALPETFDQSFVYKLNSQQRALGGRFVFTVTAHDHAGNDSKPRVVGTVLRPTSVAHLQLPGSWAKHKASNYEGIYAKDTLGSTGIDDTLRFASASGPSTVQLVFGKSSPDTGLVLQVYKRLYQCIEPGVGNSGCYKNYVTGWFTVKSITMPTKDDQVHTYALGKGITKLNGKYRVRLVPGGPAGAHLALQAIGVY